MKKLLTILLLFALIPLSVFAEQSKATLYETNTGQREAVYVGEWIMGGDWRLETSTDNIDYWVNRLKNQSENPITDLEFDLLPYKALELVSPKIEQLLAEGEEPNLGFSVVSRYKTRLSSSMTSSQTTMTVASMKTFDDTTLTMSLLGSKTFLTIEPGANKEEIVKATGISSSSWTGLTRGLAFSGTTETAVAGNRKTHNAGSVVIMSNVHYVYEQLPDKESAETITGIYTYNNYPVYASPTTVPTTTGQFATKYYVDTVGAGGLTSGNIGSGATLRVNGTVPETLDINTSTADSFIIVDGKFEVATDTGSQIDQHWNDRTNATTTKNSDFTFSDGLTVGDVTTTTDLSVTGDSKGLLNYYGNGSDGALTVTGATMHNVASSTLAANSTAGSSTITVADASQFPTSTPIFIYQIWGTNAGFWELNSVSDKNNDSNVLTLAKTTTNNYYGTPAATSTQAAQILKVPQYTNVVFKTGAGISALAEFATTTMMGGINIFYASQGVIIEDDVVLDMSGMGYKGNSRDIVPGLQGDGTDGYGGATGSYSANGTGGGGGGAAGASTNGGEHFIDALNSYFNTSTAPVLLMGGGGGGSNIDFGGDGGGIFIAITPSFINFGKINVSGDDGAFNGAADHAPGGSGAGGTIAIFSEQVYTTSTADSFLVGGGNAAAGGSSAIHGGSGGGNRTAGAAGSDNAGGAGGDGWYLQGIPVGVLRDFRN